MIGIIGGTGLYAMTRAAGALRRRRCMTPFGAPSSPAGARHAARPRGRLPRPPRPGPPAPARRDQLPRQHLGAEEPRRTYASSASPRSAACARKYARAILRCRRSTWTSPRARARRASSAAGWSRTSPPRTRAARATAALLARVARAQACAPAPGQDLCLRRGAAPRNACREPVPARRRRRPGRHDQRAGGLPRARGADRLLHHRRWRPTTTAGSRIRRSTSRRSRCSRSSAPTWSRCSNCWRRVSRSTRKTRPGRAAVPCAAPWSRRASR